MTELSEAQCTDIMERQLSSFQTRGTEFWRRQATAPIGQQKEAFESSFNRQMTAPSRKASEMRHLGFSPLAPIHSVTEDHLSDYHLSECSSQ